MNSHKKLHISLMKRPLIWGVVIVVLITGGIVSGLELTNTTYWFHKKPLPTTAGQGTKGEVARQSTQNNLETNSNFTPDQSNTVNDSGSKATQPESTYLQPPSNSRFVSSHHTQMATPISSVCNTTPGASCAIVFTMNSIAKQLPTETTDEGGSAYWNNWTPQSIGLTPGSWQIQAIAKLGSQTKTATDALDLIVQ